MDSVLERLGTLGLIPVVTLERAEDAVPLARALAEGGLPCAEITLRTASAVDAIRRVSAELPEVLIGAGTVLTPYDAQRAVEAGARYIVSPGFEARVVAWCRERAVLAIPGVATPTEIMAALSEDVRTVKFFPAETFGGIRTLSALAAPFPQMRFIPTGGITAENLLQYLRLPCVHACGGSWLVKADLVAGRKFHEIARLAEEAARIVRQVRGQVV